MYAVSGGCHCGNMILSAQLPSEPATYRPRACDCDFCRKHAAAYVSDPRGSMSLRIKEPRDAGKYRQGSAQAQLLLCRQCGVLVAALFSHDGRLYGALNARCIDARTEFGTEQTVSPQKLPPGDKVQRWRDLWFADVTLVPAADRS
jgi:hypothetical protein